ncbi:alpha-xylosidase [Lactiplantibacillus plantarum]|nr:TIM-barrel domain-containing protein [Lactiplantibacillus plantarum]MCG0592208.1 alpha-xylosidase [Lactiplantibacillus plantarum]MCG0670861.1 alpha-xylosidase [Lactiplantibacillus plantarum]MCG0872279.1 alpha-xylosidase [Lactiplantibacillus plantarum]MCG0920137.1 alpha-xylosidase [Lactiplantibacillus plantarum]OUT00929.1 Oligosaccharide 4-alpha-D-glucosyltransferase [Lactiplantibacillus plantarum]
MEAKGNVILQDAVRFTILTTCLVRIEYSKDGNFEDRNTQMVQNRHFTQPPFEIFENRQGHVLEIRTTGFHLYYDGGALSSGSLYIDAANSYGTHYSRWYYGEPTKNNLKGTARTLDRADGAIPLPDGLMSKDGFSVLDDSQSFILENGEFSVRQSKETDLYYFSYGRDYRKTLQVYYQLTGFPPMVPRYALGNWWSRFYPYTQSEYLALMKEFDRCQIPIAVSVFDMNWHTTAIPSKYGSGWTGYTWNKEYFPNPQKMFDLLHQQGRKVTLNIHPASGIRPSESCYGAVAKMLDLDAKTEEPATFDLQNKKFKTAYFDLVHHPLEEQGVDFWWIDWQQGGARGQSKVDLLWLLNVAHFRDSEKRHVGEGLILSRYAGPGSHRYPVGFSGDTVASWDSLRFQPYFTATASNIGYTWWSHDIGGHMRGTYDGELSLRWLQLGVFSPILRLHSSNNIFMGKEPWNYGKDIESAMIHLLQLRTRLVPYLDSENYRTHTEGLPLVQPMYYGYPNQKVAYEVPNEYQFGSEMVVSPITTPVDLQSELSSTEVWLPEGQWYDFFTGLVYEGDSYFKAYREQNKFPVFVKAGSILPMLKNYMQPLAQIPEQLELMIFVGTDGIYEMVEHQENNIARTIFKWNDREHQLTVETVDPAKLIPAQRQYSVILIGAEGSIDKQSATTISFRNYQLIDQSKIVTELIKSRLQRAQISFEEKQLIWQMYVSHKETKKLIKFLDTIHENTIRGMIIELVEK